MNEIQDDIFGLEDRLRNNISKQDLAKAKELQEDKDILSLATMNDEMLALVAKIAGIPFNTAKSAQIGYVTSRNSQSLDVPLEALDDKNFGSPFKRSSDTVLDTLNPYDTVDSSLLATPTLEEELEKEEQKEIVKKFLKALTPREEAVIRARFGFDDGTPKTLEAVGQMYHVTRERIRQIEAHALKKLKKRIEKSIYGDII